MLNALYLPATGEECARRSASDWSIAADDVNLRLLPSLNGAGWTGICYDKVLYRTQ